MTRNEESASQNGRVLARMNSGQRCSKRSAEAGIRAIYCEKPIATKLDDADRIVMKCDDAGALLVLNHQKRFSPNHRKLRSYIAEGGLGELTSVNLQWGNGRLGNVGTHMIDGLIMLTGRRVERVSANLDLSGKPDCRGEQFADPGGWGTLIMEGNLRVTVDAPDYSTTPACITVNGTLGRAFATPLPVSGRGGPTHLRSHRSHARFAPSQRRHCRSPAGGRRSRARGTERVSTRTARPPFDSAEGDLALKSFLQSSISPLPSTPVHPPSAHTVLL